MRRPLLTSAARLRLLPQKNATTPDHWPPCQRAIQWAPPMAVAAFFSTSSKMQSGGGLSPPSLDHGLTNPIRTTDLSKVEPDRIRTFSIIAHIDHGKSTLADRMLEHVGAVRPGKDRILDKLQVEQERGITVKAQTASVIYRDDRDGKEYLLNLIDTPGHVDFSSEVSRSLVACQGVILLVDANQGVQAQTVSNFFMAFAGDLAVVPVLNKIDLPNADPENCKAQMEKLFEIDPDDVILASAKTGAGLVDIFRAIVDRIPSASESKLRKKYALKDGSGVDVEEEEEDQVLLLTDSWFDRFRGAVNLVQVVSGRLEINDCIVSAKTQQTYTVKTLGILTPDELPVTSLHPGQMGVMTCNMRSPKEAIIGDTFYKKDHPVEPALDIRKPKPMVFAGFYPLDASEHAKLKGAIEKVSLNDFSVAIAPESSPALGLGWRLGFLGLLHLEVLSQRLDQEFDAQVLVTTPSVPYRVKLRKPGKKATGSCKPAATTDAELEEDVLEVNNPMLWPEQYLVESCWEPMVRGTIICPQELVGVVYGLCMDHRGSQLSAENIDQTRMRMEFSLPLNEIVVNFFDKLKSATSGYGSFDYEDAGFQESSLTKVDILLNEDPVKELSCVVHASRAREKGKAMVAKLKESLPRQQFAIKVQAATGSHILAREDIKPFRKDVLAKCYGGDMRRKMKLLKNQAEGKKRLKAIGNIEISKDTFIKLLT